MRQIFSSLKKKKMLKVLEALGGYVWKRPESISFEVIRAIDEDFKINRCNGQELAAIKGHNSKCLTHNLWHELTNHISIFIQYQLKM